MIGREQNKRPGATRTSALLRTRSRGRAYGVTVTLPKTPSLAVEWYGKTPVLAKVYFHVAPGASGPLSNSPGASDVTLCGTSSLLVHVSVLPTLTVTFFGWYLLLLILMALTGADGVFAALVELAAGVPLPRDPPLSSLLSPRCMEQDESNRDSTIVLASKVMRFIMISASKRAILSRED